MVVPWRKNEGDVKMNEERLQGEVVVMEKDHKEKLKMKEHVLVPKRAHTTREDLEEFGFTARCPKCLSLLKRTSREAQHGKLQKAG